MKIRYPLALALTVGASFALDAAGPLQKILRYHPLCSTSKAASPAGPAAPLPATLADWAKGARLFDGLGTFHRAAGTKNAEAQAYFDQGMRLTWGFNHDEATRSFAKAAELDPTCAMCFWGVALTLGPNYNMPMMMGPRAQVGWAALQQAVLLGRSASLADRAMIEALTHRFIGPQPIDPGNIGPVNVAYSQAMTSAADRFPDDLDLQTLAAEAQMNVLPWKLWTDDGQPAPGTQAIVARLERVLARDPGHPGANHYYIHAVEASPHPERAVAAAERLQGMMPAAGHIVHMPSHIFQRVGRYEASAEANRKGAAADLAYFAQTRAPDYYPMYTAHNYQFLAAAAAMEGRQREALAAARKARAVLSDDLLLGMPGVDWQVGFVYETLTRFGLWHQMLLECAPNPRLTALTVSWWANRAIAFAALGEQEQARRALAQLDRIIAATPTDAMAGMNQARMVYEIVAVRAHARLQVAERGKVADISLLRRAVQVEDKLAYNEPADIFIPTRQILGVALLRGRDYRGAEAVFREDLRRNPENGWSLKGLTQALAGQRKRAEAQATAKRFAAAWAHADHAIETAAYW